MVISPYAIPGLKKPKKVSMIDTDDIVNVVCAFLKTDKIKVMDGLKGAKSICYARDWCVHFIIKYNDFSLAEIGNFFGGRHYSTIINARDRVIKKLYGREELFHDKYVFDYKSINELLKMKYVHINSAPAA